ncbi:ROK family protein [Parablautia intestinalis]|uniref:ROK family protein n=1 Tax=Parablautia intestinalis TaxID=2320100 RepID=A0A3A9AP71_9FIRM|nr:ROK family protein [Parablautia intestinalis]RKI93158.1 ROK family protein [Parablautia intestinalis]
MKTCIAVDIGGTKMLVAEVREDGSIVHLRRSVTGQISREEVVRRTIAEIKEYEREFGWESGKRPAQTGIGINGVVDPVRKIWKGMEPGETDIVLPAYVEEEFSVECCIDNDVKATVIAENKFGAGKGYQNMVYINVGTGLAGGFIANGKLIRGTDGFAGEIGYMNFTGGEGPRVELMASGMGLSYQAVELIGGYPDSGLKEKIKGVVSGQDVVTLAGKGDKLANRILEEMITMNGLMISNLTCVLSPELVVLGGGLITNRQMLNRIIGAVSEKAKEHLEKGIVLTAFDPVHAGLMGAAAVGLGYQKEYE